MSLDILTILIQGAELLARIREADVMGRFQKMSGDLEAQISKIAFKDVLIGFDHLATANQCENIELQIDEMRMARMRFAQCIHLDPQGFQIIHDPRGDKKEVPNSLLIAAGHFGNFVYFSARNEKAIAVLQVYMCGVSHPEECIKIFPGDFFNENYKEKLDHLEKSRRHYSETISRTKIKTRNRVFLSEEMVAYSEKFNAEISGEIFYTSTQIMEEKKILLHKISSESQNQINMAKSSRNDFAANLPKTIREALSLAVTSSGNQRRDT